MSDENKGGYTSVTLGKELLENVDKHSADSGMNNRSLIIRLILEQYYRVKGQGVDLIKEELKEIAQKVRR